jgi:hypothetical protein
MGMKRTAAVAAGVAGATALALGLGTAPAGAAAALLSHDHTFTATSGATEVVVGWRYTDTAGVRHRGRQIAVGGRVAEATFSNVADGQLVGRHRVEFAGCAQDCTFGPYEFAPFSSK